MSQSNGLFTAEGSLSLHHDGGPYVLYVVVPVQSYLNAEIFLVKQPYIVPL